jgi:hypothetical protein
MRANNGYSQLTAYLLSALVRNDPKIRAIGPPRNRQEWRIDRVNDYLRAIGQETIAEGGEAALWVLLRGSIALLPSRREEALFRLIRLWAVEPFCRKCLEKGVVTPATIADHIIPHRGDWNSFLLGELQSFVRNMPQFHEEI